MMGRLRRKFVTVAMAAVTLVLVVMVVCINVVSYMNLCAKEDERLEMLSAGGGAFSGAGDEETTRDDMGGAAPMPLQTVRRCTYFSTAGATSTPSDRLWP